ncbi:hypothetical protein ACFWCM_23535 [Streptomyces albidoflavus]
MQGFTAHPTQALQHDQPLPDGEQVVKDWLAEGGRGDLVGQPTYTAFAVPAAAGRRHRRFLEAVLTPPGDAGLAVVGLDL